MHAAFKQGKEVPRCRSQGLVCVEAGVISDGYVAAILDGRKYDRAVRLLKFLYEALLRLARKGFLQWLENNHTQDLLHLEDTLEVMKYLSEVVSQVAVNEVAQNESYKYIFKLLEDYLNYMRKVNGPLSAFRRSYADLVGVLFGLIRVLRG